MKPIVAIVGRPNVGKSTLFNRLSQTNKAIVIDEPGATRDRNYSEAEWKGCLFTVIDTGGFEPASIERILIQMREQTMLAVEEASVIIFIMDGREGLIASDIEIAAILRMSRKPVIYAVNKIDSPKQDHETSDFYRLGIERFHTLSAQHGLGIGDILDEVVSHFPAVEAEEVDTEERVRIAVIGRPNVGKSSLVNKILGYDRTIVNPVPGTTRDAIDTPFELNGRSYLLVDTAGIRRKSRISQTLEKYTVVDAIKTIERSDVALMVIDAEDGVTEQDTKIAGLAFERGIATIVVINKWDLLTKDDSTIGIYVNQVKDRLKYLDFAPITTISALTGQRVTKIFDLIDLVYSQYTLRVSTSKLNDSLRECIERQPPSRHSGKPNKFSFATQISTKPPTFVLFVREPKAIHFSYERYLENRIRESLGFDSVPIRLIFRQKDRSKRPAYS
ncbi:MAG: ribosome biogenesis GTPase Der [Deltaproteobacteria bacterium]|nr:ribosome biogenesis GTPase Der [Deltaproteobacteria bacterium]